jgi:hypothetical protein
MEFIYEIENILPKIICEKIIDRFKKDNNKTKSKVGPGDGEVAKIRKSLILEISDPDKPEWGDIDNIFKDVVNQGMMKYREYLTTYHPVFETELFNSSLRDEGYQLNETKENEYYNWHMDGNAAVKMFRSFTVILYLNTLDENQGGNTEFLCGAKIKPKQGKMLIFPACWTYLHRGAPVKNSGVKYTMTTWLL